MRRSAREGDVFLLLPGRSCGDLNDRHGARRRLTGRRGEVEQRYINIDKSFTRRDRQERRMLQI